MDSTLSTSGDKFAKLADQLTGPALRRITNKVSLAAKKDVESEIRSDIGADMRMSNWKVKFGAGYRLTSDSNSILQPRPPGPWQVLEFGRRGKPGAFPRGRRRSKVYNTPVGLRTATQGAKWTSGKSKGQGTFRRATTVIGRETPKRVNRELVAAIRKTVGR